MERTIVSTTLAVGVKNRTSKAILTILCLLGLFWRVGFYSDCPLWNHIAYSFSHANIFHLAVNLIVLWSIKNKMQTIPALIIAIVASYLPMYVSSPTVGLSGFLFAVFGLMWGKTGRLLDAVKKVMPFIIITMLIPNMNGLLHLYTFGIGFMTGFLVDFTIRFIIFFHKVKGGHS